MSWDAIIPWSVLMLKARTSSDPLLFLFPRGNPLPHLMSLSISTTAFCLQYAPANLPNKISSFAKCRLDPPYTISEESSGWIKRQRVTVTNMGSMWPNHTALTRDLRLLAYEFSSWGEHSVGRKAQRLLPPLSCLEYAPPNLSGGIGVVVYKSCACLFT